MKKLTTLALAAMMLAPATSFAESFERVVTNASELKTALNGLGTGIEGETYTIICDWDAADKQTVGRIKPTMAKGTLIVRSNQTDFAKMPQVALSFQWAGDGSRGEAKQNLSIIFENMVIDANQDSYFIDHRMAMFADTIAIRNCDVSNFKRSCLRFDGDKHAGPIDEATGEKITRSQMSIDVIDVRNSVFHHSAQTTSDNWAVFRTFMPVNTFNIENCMFYDSPCTKSLWETRDKNETPTTLNFNNNLVLLAQNKTLCSTGFTMLNPAANIAPGSIFCINNNIIAAPRKGTNIMHNDTTTYTNDTKLVSVEGAVIMATGNVIDTTAYVALDVLAESMAALTTPSIIVLDGADNKVFGDYNVNWELGQTFQNAEKDLYYMLKSNPWYTAGVVAPDFGANNTYVGPSIAYMDEFPTTITVNVKVEGPDYVTCIISPVKEEYYKGDEVTVSFNDCNSYYRTMTNFKGWNDGNMDKVRTFVLEGDLDVTATFEPAVENLVSFFNFAGAISDSVYQADIYSEDKYRAEVYMMVADTTWGAVAPYNYIMATTAKTVAKGDSLHPVDQDMQFQSRAAKFGEDASEMQIPIITRRSTAVAHTAGQVNYAMFKLCTKNLADVKFSCYVGTDNFMFATQNLEYSIDGQTWVNFATVDMTDAKRDLDFGGVTGQVYGWKELAGTLPAEANNQDVVYVRVISDPTSTGLTNAASSVDVKVGDTHEYIGQVLITGTSTGVSYPSCVWFPSREYTITPGQVESSVPGMSLKFGTEAETAKAWSVGQYDGMMGEYEVLAYVKGNGGNPKPAALNGTPTEGTFYTFTATEAGTLTAYVSLNAGNSLYFYCVETGTALGAYDGTYQVAEKYNGALEAVQVEANKSYCLYCGGSKLGLYGFKFQNAEGIENVVVAPAQGLDLNAPIFDLTGRQVANPVKGIYLQNGRKFIVK
ncbi:MAG: hypothetical protein IJP08_09725 [Bacteroidaceae bacterium]|nr:hypothetical protein [Bacteroidaceae bacterium]